MDTRVRQVEDIVKNALGKAVTIVVDSEKTKLSEYDSMSKSFNGLGDRIAAAASVQLSSSDRPKPPPPTPTPYSIVRFRDNVGQVFDDNSKVGMYVTNPNIQPPPGNGVIYFDSDNSKYTKDTDIRSYNMQKIREEVVTGIGVFVVYGNMGDVSSLRPGVITKVTDGTDGEKIPTEIKYLPDISNPNSIETFTNGNGGEDSLLMSSTKSMSLSQQSIDKTWLCISREMLPPNIEANLLRVAELSTDNVGAQPLQQFPNGTTVKVVGTSHVYVVEQLLKSPTWMYTVEKFNPESNTYNIKTKGAAKLPYYSIPASNLEAVGSDPAPVEPDQKTPVTFDWTGEGNKVYLVGSFTGWGQNKILMTRNTNGIFTKTVELDPGKYEYKFIVDGTWMVDSNKPKNGSGANENNVIDVEENFSGGGGGRGRGRGRGRIRGTRKYQNQKRRGNGNGNMRRRITRKVKRSRRVGVVHRGGGGRGGKIYKKTKKHVRGGRGGRGRGVGHRRTIKKYHRR
jgi:hypothetical protein